MNKFFKWRTSCKIKIKKYHNKIRTYLKKIKLINNKQNKLINFKTIISQKKIYVHKNKINKYKFKKIKFQKYNKSI